MNFCDNAGVMWSVPHFVSIASFLLALVFISKILRERRHPGSTIAWLLTIVLIPYVGIPLYLIFGGRKIKRLAAEKELLYRPVDFKDTPTEMAMLERILLSTGAPPRVNGNELTLLKTGEEAYQKMIDALEQAQSSIYITTYILGSDEVGDKVVSLLEYKAKQGLRVRVLLDGWGSFFVRRQFLKKLRQAGAAVAFFMPMIRLPFTGNSNLRNHRKMIIVDGELAIVGGRNIARDYMGPTTNPKQWCDLSLQIIGPAVKTIGDVFRSDWKFASGEVLPELPAVLPKGEVTAQIVSSGPDIVGDSFYDAIVSAMFSAKNRFWVITPYLVLDETLMRSLELAARRGLDVRILLPYRSNHLLADLARGGFIRQLHAVGAGIYFYKPGMIHAKLIVIDEGCAVIGSANMDMRSLFLNYEISTFIYSEPTVEELATWYQELLTHCSEKMPSQTPLLSLGENLVRIVAPLL